MVKHTKDEHADVPAPAHKDADQKAAEAPPPVETIVDEQRKRSEEMQQQGMEEWIAAHDDRPESERPKLGPDGYLHNQPGASKQVAGITHPTTDKVVS